MWRHWTLSEVCLHQSNIACAESKLVRPHTLSVRACSFVCDSTLPLLGAKFFQCNVTTHIFIAIPIDMAHMSGRHLESLGVVGHRNSLAHAIENGPTCRSSHWNVPNIHPSEFYRGISSPVPVPCHLHIPYRIAGLYRKLRHSSRYANPYCDTRMCHRVARLGHMAQGW